MENPQKPTRNHEQEQRKTLRDYVVATFHADLDIVKRPLTVIRSGKNKEDVIYDGGWVPSAMLCVCNTDPEKGAGPTELFVEVYKTIKVNGERVPVTGIAPLNILRNLKENGVFTESYVQALYGKSTEEMLKEGAEAAEQIWRQKHPASEWNELLDVEASPETPSDSLDAEGNSEKSLKDEVSLAMGGVAGKAAGVEKPIDTNRVETNEPVREPVKTNETGVDSPALKMTKEVLASIGAVKVNDSVGLPAVESVKKPAVKAAGIKKPVEADKASAAPVDLPAAKSVEIPVVEKSMETNEANVDILPEGFKDAINEFKRLTKDNNNQFAGVARSLTGSLSEFRESITRTPTAIKDPRITEFTLRISELEASRVEILNSFIDEGFSKEMFVDSKKDPAKSTGILVKKLAGLGEILRGVYAGHSGRDSLVQAIDKIIVDLSTVSRDRWNIFDAVNKIKSVWGDDKS